MAGAISLSKCSKKLQRRISSFTCISCYDSNAVGILRYWVELIAADESDEAVFVGFCGKMTKLTNIRTLNLGIFWLQVLKTLKTVSSLCTLLTLWARVTCSSLACPTSTLLPHIRRSQSRVFSTSVSVYQFQVYLWEKRHWWPW
ncbi:hypothetical protein Rs2_15627 [Raphanus sativus]|nr:hypothetical protein Rs2_15627 [Raphanus sativus]